MSQAIASTSRVRIEDPETGQPTDAWLCMCNCPPHAEGMCILQAEEDDEHVRAGDLIFAHLSCVAPRMEPVES
ncbi:MAG TPA: hypothetical protein VFX35_12530 [Solirubrobacterales bacterium]|nr:hypothetical protein [Solirubrobacterales bacterium]